MIKYNIFVYCSGSLLSQFKFRLSMVSYLLAVLSGMNNIIKSCC